MSNKYILVSLLCLSTASCAVETIVHGIDEHEANRIIELLADNDIVATKIVIEGREISYAISVPVKGRIEAIRLLNYYELPRRRDRGYSEVFKESGLIPTAAEEKAKKMSALEGEIERQLKIVDGIIDVQVQLVAPEETVLKTTQDQQAPVTAAVTVKYLPAVGGAKPLSEPQIQAIVAGGVENLTPENVVVVMMPANKAFAARPGEETTAPTSRLATIVTVVGFIIAILLGLGLAFSQMRLRNVRERLIRLQDQIQKAKKKSEEAEQLPAS
jgi:type III secretion system YscJ/HrcJ family lipoprotein